jgi:hypothetical protein
MDDKSEALNQLLSKYSKRVIPPRDRAEATSKKPT